MPLRIFRSETSAAAQRERRERVERAMSEGFRVLSKLFERAARRIDDQRLQRSGYEKQEQFLERSKPGRGPTNS